MTAYVYRTPKGLGLIEKVRGEKRWMAVISTPSSFVNDWLVLLVHERKLFLVIHELKLERLRWMRDLALQSTDPMEE